MNGAMHGVPLIERVIESVERIGLEGPDGAPRLVKPVPLPEQAIRELRMPGGRLLPPSLRRWLAFDAWWLSRIGWFADPRAPVLRGAALSATAGFMYGFSSGEGGWTEGFGAFEALLPGMCFPLVGGSDSRRLLYAGEPDSLGEYPVLVLDADDEPFVAVMYPGFDVYLAHEAGVLDFEFDTYSDLIDHPEYGGRMREHAERTGLGAEGADIQDVRTAVRAAAGRITDAPDSPEAED